MASGGQYLYLSLHPGISDEIPTILEECQNRFRFILDHGYDTPEKVRFLLEHFIQINHLEDTLEVSEA